MVKLLKLAEIKKSPPKSISEGPASMLVINAGPERLSGQNLRKNFEPRLFGGGFYLFSLATKAVLFLVSLFEQVS